MSVTFGFYNSLNGDRKYNATQISSIFDGIINDGIYMSIGTCMMVKSSSDLTVAIGEGRAWFNHTWTLNDAELLLNLDPADVLLDRIDAVVLEVNATEANRENSIKIVKGTAATEPVRPTLTNTRDIHQYPLAYISVPKNAIAITQANITNMVGTSSTPYVTGILKVMEIDDIVAQWETQWEEWLADQEAGITNWNNTQRAAWQRWIETQENDFTNWVTEYQGELEAIKTEFDAFKTANQNDFTTWFETIKNQLSEDAAGNLQNQINDIIRREFNRYYGIVAKETIINKDASGVTTSIVENNDEISATTTFSEEGNTKTITTLVAPLEGEFNYIKTTVIVTTDSGKNITESFEQSVK